jgi:hypothetical protein
VGVWTEASSYEFGRPVLIHLQVREPAFIYVFDLQPDGRVRLLFPNSFSPNSYLPSGAYQLPDGPYQIVAAPPAGIEEILAFATYVPLPVPVGTPSDPFLLFATDPSDAIRQLVSVFRAASDELVWAVAWTAIRITEPVFAAPEDPPEIPPLPERQPPFPAQPGDAWHSVGNQWRQGIPESGWYWYYGLDLRWHLCLEIG